MAIRTAHQEIPLPAPGVSSPSGTLCGSGSIDGQRTIEDTIKMDT
ncbi:hypothetical protein EV13_2219 [Prochlorococcus sp. MIT 0702]|nr:hypothetical protein EV13_2219 [Prochlorococcus sp. MIT 0702]KGG36675.1 hypothetical protein EV14_0187 [Prochlorococcus sp. MIT 0703]